MASRGARFLSGLLEHAQTIVAVSTIAVSWRNRFTAAYMLHWNSINLNNQLPSLRQDEVDMINERLRKLDPHRELFLVVLGPPGVGKTLAVRTALAGQPGVITVEVPPGLSNDKICEIVQKEIWPRFDVRSVSSVANAAKLTIETYEWWYGEAPCVILNAHSKLNEYDVPAPVMAAAESLAKMGLRVIIDASQGQLGPSPAAHRAAPIYMDYMKWENMREIPECASIWTTLEDLQMLPKVQAVIGGCPRQLFQLKGIINGKQAGEAKELTLQFLSQQIAAAQFDVGALVAKYPFVESGLKLLGEKGEITWKELGDVPENKVLRHTEQGIFVPRSAAVQVVLRHGLGEIQPTARDLVSFL
jgi:hypothetical protein